MNRDARSRRAVGIGPHRLVATLAAAFMAAPAVALDDAADDAVALERIEVVGSRIRQADLETSQPVFVLGREAIARTGLLSVGDILQDLATHGAALNTTVNNGGDGSTRVDLRNLGDNRTLVLVDGRRWIAGLDGGVDLNAIPVALVERIEVLKDGASAIYGSDAIAGVVNLVTRRDFEGAEASAQVGESQHGDGRTESFDATIGASGDRAGVAVGVSCVKQEPILAGARAISAVPTFGVPATDVRAGASALTPGGLFGFGRFGNCPFITSGIYPASQNCNRPPGVPAVTYRTTFDLATGGYRLFDPARDGYNFAPENYLQTPQERVALFARVRYDLADAVAFSADVLHNERRSAQQLAPDQIRVGTTFPGVANVVVPADHVHNPFGQPVTALFLRPGGQVRRFTQDVDTWRFAAALEGSFALGERLWSWSASWVATDAEQRETSNGLLNYPNLQRALGPSFRDANGTPRCGTPQAPIAGCVPFDPFRGPAAFTPEMLAYALYVGKESVRTASTQYALNLTGDLLDLPAGPLAFALGLEHRRDTGESRLDAFRVAVNNVADDSLGGRVSVDEQFLELAVPLLADAPFARALDVSLAARRSDYDPFGGTTNGEAGLQWRPGDAVLLRASWSEGFRAPGVEDLFLPLRVENTQFTPDPCAAELATTPQRRANCAADGVPGGAHDGINLFRVLSGGNRDLQPEAAVSRGVGLVYSPGWLQGFDVSLDWYEIAITDAIAQASAADLLLLCADAGVPEACARTTRAPGGELVEVDARRLNSGLLAVEGWDLTARWRGETPLGRIELVWDSTYTSRYTAEIPRGAPARSAVGNNVAFEPGFRIRSNLDVAWRRGDWSAAIGARWYSGLDEPCIGPSFVGRSDLCSAPDVPNVQNPPFPENRLGARTYVDLQAGWDAPWGSRIVAGVHNAFGRDPPVSYAAFANSFDPAYPIPGRFWYLRITHAF